MLNYIRHQSLRIPRLYLVVLILLSILTLILTLTSQVYPLANSLKNPSDDVDWLAYTIRLGKKNLMMLYDPYKNIRVRVHTYDNRITFSLSKNGYLAFSSGINGKPQISIWDTHAAYRSSTQVDQNSKAANYPLAWSPDGRYLAFVSYLDGKHYLIYVWDGKTTINITPNDLADSVQSYNGVSWSFDGRFAFTVWFDDRQSKGDPSEIYLWDGKTTTSLSQNPTGRDESPTWSADNRFAFLSDRGGKYGIYVWDGVSIKNGSPKVDTFTNVAPQLTTYESSPKWTSEGLLTFSTYIPQDTTSQIYRWDGQTATNISQTSTEGNGLQTWSADGRWAFATFYSPKGDMVYVRDANNRTLLAVKGTYPAWSSTGYLTFCTLSRSGWVLSIWDGQQVKAIAQGGEIWAQWGSGSRSICYSG
ncbi:MAG: hypothetical protein ABI947_26970 [Chloroflexota bacterium]